MKDAIEDTLKRAKRLQARGKLERARQLYEWILTNPSELSDRATAVALHNRASLRAINHRAKEARTGFKAAIKLAGDDPVTRARTRRDFANFVLLNDADTKEARAILTTALRELATPEARRTLGKKKLEIEVAVTQGFVARVSIVEGKSVEAAVAKLRVLDIKLEEYATKPVYQLANLDWIIDTITDPIDKEAYIHKAIQLAKRIGNVEKQREYQLLLLGGRPARFGYTTLRTAIDLGTNVAKVATRPILRRFI